MTDENPQDHEPVLDEAQERRVRRLLADSRHTEPMPTEIAARLDQVLRELAEHPDVPTESQTPVELASRRRHRVSSMLVAAAAVVVIGVGLGQLVGTRSSPEASSPASDAAAGATSLSESGASDVLGGTGEGYALATPLRIREDSFSTDVEDARRALTAARRAGNAESQATSSPENDSSPLGSAAFDCILEEWGPGAFVPVTYTGAPGVLVFRKASEDSQVVDLFGCGSPEVLRSITLPAP